MAIDRALGNELLKSASTGYNAQKEAQLNNQAALQRQTQEDNLKKYLTQQEKGVVNPDGSYTPGAEELGARQRYNTVKGDVESASKKGVKLSASMSKEGASYSENQPDMFTKQRGLMKGEGKDLDTAAQKTAAPIRAQLDQINMMHKLLDSPNSVDAKQLGAGFARITEGQGQRLLQSLVESMGAPADVVADSTKAMNFLTAAAGSPIGSATHQAMRQNLFKHQAMLQDQHDQLHQQFLQRGTNLAPDLDSSRYESAWNSAGPTPKLLQDLKDRQSNFEKQTGAHPPVGIPPQAAAPSGLDKLLAPLRNMMGGGGQAATQPAAQSGTMRVKHIASGQTGTIPASEFDPNQYQQVQ